MAKGKRVLRKLLSMGWKITRQSGSHRRMSKPGLAPFTFAFHDHEEIGPPLLAKIAKQADCKPKDLL